ncbi:MAG: hypothetical protein U0228_33580 [Myxococcaceae bacterium]
MRTLLRGALLVLPVLVTVGCGAKGPADSGTGGCLGIGCPAGQTCDSLSDTCVMGTGSRCTGGCGGAKPFCDEQRGACVACTTTDGCSGATPQCNVNDPSGPVCVECLTDAQCPGSTCAQSTRTCRSHPDAGIDAGVDAGTGSCPMRCSGTTPKCDDATQQCVQCLVTADCGGGSRVCDAQSKRCVLQPSDGGTCITPQAPMTCTATCMEGFNCQGGTCVLNGGGGPVQVTVRWDTDTDVDLHVDEPLPDGGVCEIYYGDTGGQNSSCGAVGELDLDSNAGCSIDGVDIENIIYPSGSAAPSGTYTVRVDYYDNCGVTTSIPYEIEVRANGQTTAWCDVFVPADADSGGAGDGRVITTFTVP